MPGLPYSLQKLKVWFSEVQIKVVLLSQQADFISFFKIIFSSNVHTLKYFPLFLCTYENSQADLFFPFSLLFVQNVEQEEMYILS